MVKSGSDPSQMASKLGHFSPYCDAFLQWQIPNLKPQAVTPWPKQDLYEGSKVSKTKSAEQTPLPPMLQTRSFPFLGLHFLE